MTTEVDAQAAGAIALVLGRRALVRPPEYLHLIPFVEATLPGYDAQPVHRLIADRLEAVERGDIRRLMIFVQPRIGKSELVSIRFPAWYLGRHPDRRVITASHTADLAHDFGRQARDLVESEAYGRIFPGVMTSADSAARDRWNLAGRRGGYISAGVGGPLTGSGGDIAVIDDPFKDRVQADSALYRERVWRWYNDVLRTRLQNERGAIILTHTRWHTDDLAGRLLDKERGGWEILELPALAELRPDPRDPSLGPLPDALGREEGEPLWPAKFGAQYLEELRQSDVDFDALYQQRPTVAGGASFRQDWFHAARFDAGDVGTEQLVIARYISWDTGLKDKETSDPSAFTVFELLPDYRVLVRRVGADRMQFPDLVDAIAGEAARWNYDGKLRTVIIEDKVSGTSAYQTLMQAAPEWLRSMLFPFQPSGSKQYRAAQAAVWCKLGCVLFPYPTPDVPWLADFETQLFQFPTVAHDDMVDSFSQGIIYLEHFISEGWRFRNERMVEAQDG